MGKTVNFTAAGRGSRKKRLVFPRDSTQRRCFVKGGSERELPASRKAPERTLYACPGSRSKIILWKDALSGVLTAVPQGCSTGMLCKGWRLERSRGSHPLSRVV